MHTKIGGGRDVNCSSARVLYYPPLPPSFDFGQVHVSDEDQALLRKYEHVDYGSLTLLFPDPVVGGLQVSKWMMHHGSRVWEGVLELGRGVRRSGWGGGVGRWGVGEGC
jgi:isopenicillin N synthase-like dioxygenase